MGSIGDSTSLMLPLVTLLMGLGGSLHCAGMCGPLVLSVAPDKKTNFLYQLGRLLGYSLLCVVVGLVGREAVQALSPQMENWSSVFIGLCMVLVGLRFFFGKSAFSSMDRLLAPLQKVFPRLARLFHSAPVGQKARSFLVGSASVFLPCGLLYMVVFSLIAFHGVLLSLLAVFFFWLGTLPAMIFGPQSVFRIFRPWANRMPRLIGSLCVLIGLLTVGARWQGPGHSTHSHSAHSHGAHSSSAHGDNDKIGQSAGADEASCH